MWKRSLSLLWVVCAAFLLLGCLPGTAYAQEAVPAHPSLVKRPNSPGELLALFKRPAVPPRLFRLEGPDTLFIGEEGLFMALANVDAASLPLRAHWDFGDGTTASSLHVRHRYTAPGTYTVTFRLSNRHGAAPGRLVVTVMPAANTTGAAQARSAAR